MTGFTYLLSRKIKNRLKLALKRPSELILAAMFVLLVVFSATEGNYNSAFSESYRSIKELYAIILGVFVFTFVTITKKGFENGATMFSMADVNLIFTSPRKPKTVLFYGILSQMGRAVAFALIILYQYGLLSETYGADLKLVISILLGYAVTVLYSQMLSMIIYSLTSKSDTKTKAAKVIFYSVIGVFALYLLFSVKGQKDMLSAVISAANSDFMNFFPVAGAARYVVVVLHNESYVKLIVPVLCFLAFLVLYYIALSLINSDYYEDVLKATEVSFSAITARKEGKVRDSVPKKIKKGKTGFKKGFGASALYEKHKIENRRNRLFALSLTGFIMAAITIVFTYVVKDQLGGYVFNLYISVFSVGAGRWAKELRLPYAYMIPEKPFIKLLNILKEQIPAIIVESLITFVPMYFLFNLYITEIIAFCLGKIGFSFLCIGVNLLFQRYLGNGASKSLILFMYFLVIMLFSLPYILTTVVLMSAFYLPLDYAMIFASLMNFLVSAILIYISRNVLSLAEHNNK